MTVGEKRVLEVVRSLVSESAQAREAACGAVTDWISGFSPFEARLLAMTLTLAASCEQVADCRESELHTLHELLDSGFAQSDILDVLDSIDRSTLDISEREYMANIYEWLNENPR